MLERQVVFLQRLQKDAEVLEDYHKVHLTPAHLLGGGDTTLALVQKAIISVEIRKAHMEQTFAESNRVLDAVSDTLPPSERSADIEQKADSHSCFVCVPSNRTN